MSSVFISREKLMEYLKRQKAEVAARKAKHDFVTEDVCDGMESAITAFMNFVEDAPCVREGVLQTEKAGRLTRRYVDYHGNLCVTSSKGSNSVECMYKLAELEDFAEQGLLVKLPCRVGATVYEVLREGTGGQPKIRELGVVEIMLRGGDVYMTLQDLSNSENDYFVSGKEFGKTLFTMKEDAEKELKRLDGLTDTELPLMPPFKVGDKVYILRPDVNADELRLGETEIMEIRLKRSGWAFLLAHILGVYSQDDIGRRVFLNRSDAEVVLEKKQAQFKAALKNAESVQTECEQTECEQVECDQVDCEEKKSSEYVALGKETSVLRFPCALGDMLYVIRDGGIREYKVIQVDYHSKRMAPDYTKERKEFYIEAVAKDNPTDCYAFWDNAFGNDVFLTKDGAEKAKKEMKVDVEGGNYYA